MIELNKHLEINFEEIKGYKKLSENAKKLFENTYKKHNAMLGMESKKRWIPKKVQENSKFLRVDFKNGEWLHYYANGTWG